MIFHGAGTQYNPIGPNFIAAIRIFTDILRGSYNRIEGLNLKDITLRRSCLIMRSDFTVQSKCETRSFVGKFRFILTTEQDFLKIFRFEQDLSNLCVVG